MSVEQNRAKGRRVWQFSLRDLLSLTLIAGLAAGWWIDHRSQVAAVESAREDHEKTKAVLKESLEPILPEPTFKLLPRLRYEPPLPSAKEWNSGQSPLGPPN